MRNRFTQLVALLIVALLVAAAPALAHEHREVGEYTLTFGWQEEPALAGLMNGPELFIEMAHHDEEHAEAEGDHEHTDEASEPEAPADMSAVEVNLQAEVSFGSQTMTITFRPAWGETGHYIAELIPTLPGDYSFHITGTIGETAVDEVFTSADGDFSTVEPVTDVMFPALPLVDNARLEALEARVAELEAQLAELQGS